MSEYMTYGRIQYMKKKQVEGTKALTEYIRERRKEQKLTQKDIADAMGISRSLYAQIETGVRPPIYHMDDIIKIFGKETMDCFPYDIQDYTNHRLLVYMLVFGVGYKQVAQAFHLNTNQIRMLVFSKRKEFIIQYKDEIEALFPQMHTIKDYGEIQIIGKNSISIKINKKTYIFLYIIGKRKGKDTMFSLIYS